MKKLGKVFRFVIRSVLWSLLYLTYTFECKWSEKINSCSKAIIKLKHFSKGPDKKLGVQNDGLELTKLFTWPKIRKLFILVMDFCKTFWEIFYFFQKSKTAHFLGQFTTRHVWILEKSHIPWQQARKNEQNVHQPVLVLPPSSQDVSQQLQQRESHYISDLQSQT